MSTSEYEQLEREHSKEKRLSDHSVAWEKLQPIDAVNGVTHDRIEAFCRSKRITFAALVELGTRVRTDANGGVELAWGYPHGGAITAVKFRPLGDKKRYALEPSTFVQPLVLGDIGSLEWFIAEGETDSARLFGV